MAQSFCPSWLAAHTYRLQLSGVGLAALATQVRYIRHFHCIGVSVLFYQACSLSPLPAFTPLLPQSMRVEVWHRCPRGAAAAAGAGGGDRRQREVLLGAGAAPLLDVLRRPQVCLHLPLHQPPPYTMMLSTSLAGCLCHVLCEQHALITALRLVAGLEGLGAAACWL